MKRIFFTLIKGAAFYFSSVLGLVISVGILKYVPWMISYSDFLISLFISLSMGITYYFFGENRRLTLIFCGFVRIIYLCVLTYFFRQVNGITLCSVTTRCLIGSINTITSLFGFGILFGKRLSVIPIHPTHKERTSE